MYRKTYVLLVLFISFFFFFVFFFLLALRSQNQWMDCSWVCYEQLGVLCNFNITMIGFFASTPYFWGDGKLPQILPKIWWCPHLAPCHNQTAQRVKAAKYSFERWIIALHFDECEYTSLPSSYVEEMWQVSFKSTRFTIVRQMVHRCWADSLLLWRME